MSPILHWLVLYLLYVYNVSDLQTSSLDIIGAFHLVRTRLGVEGLLYISSAKKKTQKNKHFQCGSYAK